jgi:hypothetical protein
LVDVFEPEDGGDMFLRNVSQISVDYAALYQRRSAVFFAQSHLPTGAGTKGQLVAVMPSELSITPPYKLENKIREGTLKETVVKLYGNQITERQMAFRPHEQELLEEYIYI